MQKYMKKLPVCIEAGGRAADPGDVLNVDELDAPHLVAGEHQQLTLTELSRAHLPPHKNTRLKCRHLLI
jgi:hypothetical protein